MQDPQTHTQALAPHVSIQPQHRDAAAANIAAELPPGMLPDATDVPANMEAAHDNDLAVDAVPTDLESCCFPSDAATAMQGNMFVLAPGAGQKPQGVCMDRNFQQLAYPGIYGGQRRQFGYRAGVTRPAMKWSQICRAELRCRDRRCASHIASIFTMLSITQSKKIASTANFRLRRGKVKRGKGAPTACDMLTDDYKQQLAATDIGYQELLSMPFSPASIAKAKKEGFAQVRQQGIPTVFLTLSADDRRWRDLLHGLSITVDGKQRSDEELAHLNELDRKRLLRMDPVTTERYFKYRFEMFKDPCIMKCREHLGEVTGWLFVREYQQRLSPHMHGFLWIKDAPKFDAALRGSIPACQQYIDTIATTDSTRVTPELAAKQRHRCFKKLCQRRTSKTCRFHAPWLPMSQTRILTPLTDDEATAEQKQQLKLQHDVIKNKVDDIDKILHAKAPDAAELGRLTSMTVQQFLAELAMTEDAYIAAVRASISKPTTFLRRHVRDLRTNSFHPRLLTGWDANMDIQFVLNPYAALYYMLDYVIKDPQKQSDRLRQVCKECAHMDTHERTRAQGNAYVKGQEIGAPQTVAMLLGFPFKPASAATVFVDTSPPEERVAVVKDADALKAMDAGSTDITYASIIDKFHKYHAARLRKAAAGEHHHFPDLPLADYAAWYVKKPVARAQTDTAACEAAPEDEAVEAAVPEDAEATCRWMRAMVSRQWTRLPCAAHLMSCHLKSASS